jgi:hypothetical protein
MEMKHFDEHQRSAMIRHFLPNKRPKASKSGAAQKIKAEIIHLTSAIAQTVSISSLGAARVMSSLSRLELIEN